MGGPPKPYDEPVKVIEPVPVPEEAPAPVPDVEEDVDEASL